MLNRQKFASICEMMRSDNDNERAVAARLATDMLKRASMTWSDLILDGVRQPPTPPPRPRPNEPPQPASQPSRKKKSAPEPPARTRTFEGVAAEVVINRLSVIEELSPWEQTFVKTLKTHGTGMGFTRRQWDVLRGIALKYGAWLAR